MALELWETLKESSTAHAGLSPNTFFTVVVVGFAIYYVVSNLFGSSDDGHVQRRSRSLEKQKEPLRRPVYLGELSSEELKMYDGSDPKKPLLMAVKGQIYDVTPGWGFYGPGELYNVFTGKDASRALAKMSYEDKYLNGDLNGLSVNELRNLQDWEDAFMGGFVKVGTVKTTVPLTDDGPSKGQAEEASQSDAAKLADAEVAKPAENGPLETAAPKET